jgi:uncharacterized spore protein YtfJ
MSDVRGHEVETGTARSDASFIERLADRVGVHTSARTVYADPVEHGGVTVIPVAKVRWGFGGGSGSGKGDASGSGGGGGVQVWPIGYIELKDGTSAFRPIRDPSTLVPVVVAGGLVGWLLLRGLRKLIRS